MFTRYFENVRKTTRRNYIYTRVPDGFSTGYFPVRVYLLYASANIIDFSVAIIFQCAKPTLSEFLPEPDARRWVMACNRYRV